MKKITQSKLNTWGVKTKASFIILLITALSVTHAQTFSYTGDVQAVTLAPGTYKLELWGANGGNGSKGTGGKGGYSTGTLTIAATATYYIYVGGKGTTATSPTQGGWNGGGSCVGTFSNNNNGGTGGGGSDIRTTHNTTYADRLIVAGGGGGGTGYENYTGNGGYGGGMNGSNGESSRGATYAGGGGSQTAGGTSATGGISSYSLPGGLGIGGNYTGTLGGTAGGGGYYGGGSGHWGGAGGGGSSYISSTLTAGETIPFGQPGFVANPDNTGNGTVRFTKMLSTAENITNNEVTIYPNPATDWLNIKKVSDKASFTIFAQDGKLVSNGTVTNKKINVSYLTAGVYIISISENGKTILQTKLIKK